jgi:putative oxidoreductase
MQIGLFLIRAVLGVVFIGHGTQKLFGWFGGGGIGGAGRFFDSVGYRPGPLAATATGIAETSGGVGLLLGFLTPLASLAIIVVMIGAIGAVHWSKGMWNTNGGIEYPLTLAVVALGLAFTGPGRYSIDRKAGLHGRGVEWGLGILVAAVLLGAAAVIFGSMQRKRPQATTPEPNEPRPGRPAT